MELKRNERQISLFGRKGQELIEKTRIVIVGVGGLGSHVVQQLSYLGVSNLIVIDPDEIEESNLNRLIGAYPDDIGIKKTTIASRLAKQVNPSIKVKAISKDLKSVEAFSKLKEADCVFGCVDNDGARLIINEFCCAYEIPCIDLATEIFTDEPLHYGGRVFVNNDMNGCLYCYGEIDARQAGLDLSSLEARKDREDIYGVPNDTLEITGPSVVSLNGVIASLAVAEFMAMTTGLRQPNQFIHYYGNRNKNIVCTKEEPVNVNCYYCKFVRGQKDKASLDRYLK